MEQAIIDSIRNELNENIISKRQVVYLLVQVRKLLEVKNQKLSYKSLTFHCSWTMHAKMTFTEAQNVLTDFDNAHAEVLRQNVPKLHALPQLTQDAIVSRMLYSDFRPEFERFLKDNGIPSHLPTDAYKWGIFLGLYTDVIAEVPLEFNNNSNIVHLTSVSVRKLQSPPEKVPDGQIVLFGVEWTVGLKNSTVRPSWSIHYTLDINLLTAGGHVLSPK